MSLSNITSITPSSATIQDACTDETNNYVRFVESTSNTFRIYNLATGTQVGSNVSILSSCSGVSLISSASAIVVSSAVAQGFDLIELATNYRQNYGSTPNADTPTNTKGQLVACDPSAKIAFICRTTTNTLHKVDGNTFTRSNVTVPFRGCQANCIIFKSSGRWLVGTQNTGGTGGAIYEIDSNGNVVDYMEVLRKDIPGNYTSSTEVSQSITFLSYSDNFVIASLLNGEVVVIDWTSKTIVHEIGLVNGANGTILSNSASGIIVATPAIATNLNKVLFEIDPTLNASHCASPGFTDSVNIARNIGINTINNKGWMVTSNKLFIFDIVPRSSTTITVTVQDPPSTNIKSKLWLIQDDGVGASKILLETYFKSPADYRVPTGKTIRALIKSDDGVNAKYSMSVFNT